MKINELPQPFEVGSVYVRHAAEGSGNKNIAGVVTSKYVDLDGNSHFNVEEFFVVYGSPSHAYKSFRATSDLEFVSQSLDLFLGVLEEVSELVVQQIEAPEKKLKELNELTLWIDVAAQEAVHYENGIVEFEFEDDSEAGA